MIQMNSHPLAGKRGLVLGIANEHSIAYGCAEAFRALGAEVAVTFLNDKAKPYVEPLAKTLAAPIFMPCDVSREGELEAVFERIGSEWGQLDFALHSIAFAPRDDLHGRLVDCSRDGFLTAMDMTLIAGPQTIDRLPPVPRPAPQRGPEPVSEYAKRPAMPTPPAQQTAHQGLDLHGRQAPAVHKAVEDDQLDIPAFLRRQAN